MTRKEESLQDFKNAIKIYYVICISFFITVKELLLIFAYTINIEQ